MKTCKDCGNEIALYTDFPGPRCLACHAREFNRVPPERWDRPDFGKTVNKRALRDKRTLRTVAAILAARDC